eukprot:COSAG01_NODE_32294_length_583_cov_1.657025_1_plen_38_part_10
MHIFTRSGLLGRVRGHAAFWHHPPPQSGASKEVDHTGA